MGSVVMSGRNRSGRRRGKKSLYTRSAWVETTYVREGKEILLPVRARAIFRGSRARGESQILKGGVWVHHMLFPWCDLGCKFSREHHDELGASIADAIIEHFEEYDRAGLEEVLKEAPVVDASSVDVLA